MGKKQNIKWGYEDESSGESDISDVWDELGRKWPTIVYIETTNFCNAFCLSCLNHRCKRKRGIMSLKDFKLIVDKLKERDLKIGAMFCFGEPLIDPTLFKKFEYAKKKNVLVSNHIGLNTNVSLLTKDRYNEILNNTSNIILSFFNTGSEYERLTGGLDWENSYNNAIEFIKYRDKFKPKYPIFISTNKVKGHNLENVKKAFKGYNVVYVQDAELRWGGSVITGVVDRMIMYPKWRCDGYKGALQVKWDGSCEFCAYDIIGSKDGGETKFGNILEDSWEELEMKFRLAWKDVPSLCERCDYWHKCKIVMKEGFKKPNPLPKGWYGWQDKFLKEGEKYED